MVRQRQRKTRRGRRPGPFRRFRRRQRRARATAKYGTTPEEVRRHASAAPIAYGLGLLASLVVWAAIAYLLIRLL